MSEPASEPPVRAGDLWFMAFDHRNSLRRSFFGITGRATASDHERARRLKSVIFDGVLRAAEQGVARGRVAVLVDEEYGADVIARARDVGIPVAVAVERSGRSVVEFEHGDDGFARALALLEPDYAKVLVRYNPDDDPEHLGAQRRRLDLLQTWSSRTGRSWMLELLVPPTPRQLATAGGAEVFDREERPALTVRAASQLADHGLAPQLWKLEGMPTSADYAAVAAACGADGVGSTCLVLGRGADQAAVDRWLTLAAPVTGFGGFAVGRTLWWDPMADAMTGRCSDGEAADRIAHNYRRLIDVYVRASVAPIRA